MRGNLCSRIKGVEDGMVITPRPLKVAVPKKRIILEHRTIKLSERTGVISR